jgi:CBS domain-containing protein
MTPMLDIEIQVQTVAGAMHVGLFSCTPDTPLPSVALMMARHSIHCVVVIDYGFETDEAEVLWGVVSDRDLAAAVAAGKLSELTARTVAAEPLITIGADEPLADAARLMVENAVSHVVVLDERSRRPVGVVSTLDVARAVAASGAA